MNLVEIQDGKSRPKKHKKEVEVIDGGEDELISE